MHYYEVAPNKIIRANASSFTYSSGIELSIGHVVVIEIGKKHHTGLVIRKVQKPKYDTKPIIKTVDNTPLPENLVSLAQWIAAYYGTHLATVLQTILPSGLTKNRRKIVEKQRESVRNRTHFLLNNAQSEAVNKIITADPGTLLLHGVTGSGKTAVYIEAAKKVLESDRSVIILVPEIALTSQLVDEFSHFFENVILTHSKQTEAQRHQAWLDALHSNTPRVVIGPRSALFMPVSNIGLIVIDEAHEPSFKQEQSPRYSALRAASILSTSSKARLVLGSATPLVTDYYLASGKPDSIITLPDRAITDAAQPKISIIDMTKRHHFSKHRFISDSLIDAISHALKNDGQALIFHNRRGSASTTLCEDCGWSASCPRCFLPLTLHTDTHQLRCHTCGHTEKVPTSCPVCASAAIIHKGIGTKLIENELQRLFPHRIIERFDGDAESGNTVEARYKDLYNGSIDIIIGTQVIAKGLDLPHLRTVGVIQADAGLALPDYASPERTFQLLAQVVGRVGRTAHETSVIVQSYQPNHYAVTTGIKQDYAAFYNAAITERKRALFPPFTYLLKLTCSFKTEATAIRNAQAVARTLRQNAPESVTILGPTPSFYERLRDQYRWQLTIKSTKRSDLMPLLEYLPPNHWQYELDPTSLL